MSRTHIEFDAHADAMRTARNTKGAERCHTRHSIDKSRAVVAQVRSHLLVDRSTVQAGVYKVQ